jgi:thiol-disulfide isomerase/thioredoxin
VIALVVALALAGSPDAGSTAQTKAQAHVEVVKSAEEFLALPAFHAKGVHVVHFWATWCESCRVELPEYMKRAKQLAKHGVDFTFVSVDRVEDVEPKVLPFLRDVNGDFDGARHVLLGPKVVPDTIADSLERKWDGDIPVTFIYRDGKQLGFYAGRTEEHALDHVLAK